MFEYDEGEFMKVSNSKKIYDEGVLIGFEFLYLVYFFIQSLDTNYSP